MCVHMCLYMRVYIHAHNTSFFMSNFSTQPYNVPKMCTYKHIHAHITSFSVSIFSKSAPADVHAFGMRTKEEYSAIPEQFLRDVYRQKERQRKVCVCV